MTDADPARLTRLMGEAGAIQFRCTLCPEVVTIGDYDPSHRADWLHDLVQNGGWIETASGLVCPRCASRPDGATTH